MSKEPRSWEAQLVEALGTLHGEFDGVPETHIFDDPAEAEASSQQEALDAAQSLLEAYRQARPAGEAPNVVHVLLGESPSVGEAPQTFTFATPGECEAFVRALELMQGNQDYRLCQSADEAWMADGVLRRVPAGVNAEEPVIAYQLHTADACSKSVMYGVGDERRLVEFDNGAWTEEPTQETVSVDVEVHFAPDDCEQYELSGDQHRDLESSGLLDDYLLSLAGRDVAGAEEVLQEAQKEGLTP